MREGLTIGEFSRVTHLSVKTLHHYHDVGLLAPVHVSQGTGYRYYSLDQVPIAQVIVRLRNLDMPVPDVKAVLATQDVDARNQLITSHLARLEHQLSRTQSAVEALRDLLNRPVRGPAIEHRTVAAQPAMAIREVVERQDIVSWWQGALGELYGLAAAQKLRPTGPVGGVFANEILVHEQGEALVFVPVDLSAGNDARPIGRVKPLVVPGAELAVATHHGPLTTIDLTYGDLGTYTARHEIGIDGPLREYYLRNPLNATPEEDPVTEVGWPIFRSDGRSDVPGVQ
ncbi:MerR family transcriptional regulator [Nocardia sp. NEAU-G5]|uniref:MerR family transcriptional regulator n=1 Tax=Nocardia albiluteola TaxID=2842303 RepID=A0ABS6B225_9NOCA|nr:MerR family transcriptional regulator [Nocardia albiluteola]MBU3064353.1 MerR family transcriptional regulator [Nocardia albiluteola]